MGIIDFVQEGCNQLNVEGYIEGYYGRLFSKQERELLLDHMGRLKMDFIFMVQKKIYHRVMWEKLYPRKKRSLN